MKPIILWPLLITLSMTSLAAYLIVIHPRHELARVKQYNKHMAVLRDRLRANSQDRDALKEMMRAVHSSDRFEQATAAEFLGEVGPNAEPAVDALIKLLDSTNPYARRGAAIGLGGIGPNAERAIPALTKAVEQNPHADVGWFAAKSLGQIADPDDHHVIEVLEKAEKASDERLRYSAAEALRVLESRLIKQTAQEGPETLPIPPSPSAQ
jgi:HEAT repeat protein